MSIEFIKQNLKKFDKDNLIYFLFDIITCGGIDSIEDFNAEKSYVENDKVYYQDSKGFHHIYKCKVEKSTSGMIVNDEWDDLLQSFRKPIIDADNILSSIEVIEEVIISLTENQKSFTLQTKGVEDDMYDVIVFHPELGRLARTDFSLVGKTIILKDEFKVNNIGGKLIVDLYRNNQ